jgi:hypothetical protein
MGNLAGHGCPLQVAVIKAVHPQGGQPVKIGRGGCLERRLPAEAGMPLIAKTVKNKKNTTHKLLDQVSATYSRKNVCSTVIGCSGAKSYLKFSPLKRLFSPRRGLLRGAALQKKGRGISFFYSTHDLH